MKRWLLTAGVATTAGLAVAQPPAAPKPPGYLIIRVKLSDTGGGGGAAGGMGAPGMGGPGGMLGGGLGGMGGQGGPGGRGGQMGPSGGMPGQGPGGRGGGGPGGILGGGGLGGPGMGGPGGIGGLGGPGFGGPGTVGGSAPGGPLDLSAERSVAVLVPFSRIGTRALYKDKPGSAERNPSLPVILHEYGSTVLYQDGTSIQMKVDEINSLGYQVTQEYKKWAAQADRKPADLLRLVDKALRANLVDSDNKLVAYNYAEALEKLVAEREGQSVPADVASFVAAFKALTPKLAEPLAPDPVVPSLRLSLSGATVSDDAPHYSVIHFGGSNLSPESLDRKVKLLEQNFRAFYLWHALKAGKALPMPEKKLVVLVAKQTGERAMTTLQGQVDGLSVVGDSFFSPTLNLAVIAPERGDDIGRSFFDAARAKYTRDGFDRNELLRGNHPPLKAPLTPTDIALASTYALVDKVLEKEADAAAVSRAASRQLFAATGLLPRHVVLPNWVETGASSLLQHPRGTGVVELAGKKAGLALGLYTGYGAANYDLLREFQVFYPTKDDKEKTTNQVSYAEVLRNTLTDRYFEAARSGTDPDAPIDIAAAPTGGAGGGLGMPGGGIPGIGGIPSGGGPGGRGGPPGGGRGGPGGRDSSASGQRSGSDEDIQKGGPGGAMPGEGGPGQGPGGFGGPGLGGQPGGFNSGILDPNQERPALTKDRLEVKSRATAWALTYYLTQKQMPKLLQFYAELDKMPRDLRIDKTVALNLFCTVFGLMNEDKTTINDAAFKTFARDWFLFIRDTQPSWREITLESLGSGNNPNRPGGNNPGFGGLGGLGGSGPGEGGPGGGGFGGPGGR